MAYYNELLLAKSEQALLRATSDQDSLARSERGLLARSEQELIRSYVHTSTPVSGFTVSQPSGYGDRILSGFNDMRKQSLMTDFTIKLAGGQSIPVHKMVLSVACDYFKALFESGKKEATKERCLETMNERAVCSVIDYLYGRDIKVGWNNTSDYLEIVEILQLADLKQQIDMNLSEQVQPTSSFQWLQYSDRYGLGQLKRTAYQMLNSNFVKACMSKEFESFSFAQVVALLGNKEVSVVTSDARLKAVIMWIMHGEVERKHLFPNLLERIDLKKCSSTYLKYVLDTYTPTLINHMSVYAKLSKAMVYDVNSVDLTSDPSGMIIIGSPDEQYGNDEEYLIEVPENEYGNDQVYQIDFKKQSASKIGTVTSLMKSHPVRCSTQCGLFCAGKSRRKSEQSASRNKSWARNASSIECFLLDIVTIKLTSLPALRCPFRAQGAAAIGEKVYVIGGDDKDTKLCCLDLKAKSWSSVANMQQDDGCHILCSIGAKIYVLTKSKVSQSWPHQTAKITLQCYDTIAEEWSVQATPVPDEVKYIGTYCTVVVGKDIYILHSDNHPLLCYKTVRGNWSTLKGPLGSKYHLGSAVHLDGTIALCGRSSSDGIQLYDIAEDTWKSSPVKLPTKLDNLVCVPL